MIYLSWLELEKSNFVAKAAKRNAKNRKKNLRALRLLCVLCDETAAPTFLVGGCLVKSDLRQVINILLAFALDLKLVFSDGVIKVCNRFRHGKEPMIPVRIRE